MRSVQQTGPAFALEVGSTRFTLTQGDVLEQAAEALLCYSSTSLTLHSNLAQRIVARGGPTIRAEGLKHAPAERGSTLALPAGKLSSRYLLVAVTNALRDAPTLSSLHGSMRAACAHIAHYQLQSIAVPLLRAGRSLTPEETLRATISPLIDHCCGPSSLREVVLVVDEDSEFGTAARLGRYLSSALEELMELGTLRAQAAALQQAERHLLPFEAANADLVSQTLHSQLDLQIELLQRLDQRQAVDDGDVGAVLVELGRCGREVDRLSVALEARRAAALRERAVGE